MSWNQRNMLTVQHNHCSLHKKTPHTCFANLRPSIPRSLFYASESSGSTVPRSFFYNDSTPLVSRCSLFLSWHLECWWKVGGYKGPTKLLVSSANLLIHPFCGDSYPRLGVSCTVQSKWQVKPTCPWTMTFSGWEQVTTSMIWTCWIWSVIALLN